VIIFTVFFSYVCVKAVTPGNKKNPSPNPNQKAPKSQSPSPLKYPLLSYHCTCSDMLVSFPFIYFESKNRLQILYIMFG